VNVELLTINIKDDSATLKGLIFVAKFSTKNFQDPNRKKEKKQRGEEKTRRRF
jgi:hypothetical protein